MSSNYSGLNRTVFALMLAATLLFSAEAWALSVGDKAPKLEPTKWLKGSASDPSAGGKIHIVEFWATWCGPCLKTIPHLNELHAKYKDKLKIIGVTNEDEATVTKFFGRMNMDYTIALDTKRTTNETYMKGVRGIPHAFIVNEQGVVVWKGHPMSGMDQALAQVMSGNFDITKSTKLAKAKDEMQQAMRNRDMAGFIAAMDKIYEMDPTNTQIVGQKLHMMTGQNQLDARKDFVEDVMNKGHVEPLRVVAEFLATADQLAHRDLGRALRAANMAVKADPASANSQAVLARVYNELGWVEKALAAQTKAVEVAKGSEKKDAEAVKTYYQELLDLQKAQAAKN